MSTELVSESVIEEDSASLTHSETDEAQALTLDDIFHLLQNSRRRDTIEYLRAHSDQEAFEMREMATQVAAWENDKPIEEITSTERQRVYISLYQSHLPKLDEEGIIDYNQSRGIVRPNALLEYVGQFLPSETEVANSDSDAGASTWFRHLSATKLYTAATLFGLLLVSASWLELMPAALTDYLAVVIVGFFATITLAVRYQIISPPK